MTRRPDPFQQQAIEEILRKVGCPDSFVSPTISNYRLFVPILFAELGEERIFELVSGCREELGLGEQNSAWRSAAKYLAAWAEEVLEDYKRRRGNRLPEPEPEVETQQPRLL